MKFIRVQENKIADIATGSKSPGECWQEVPQNFGGNVGDKLDWFDADMRRIPDHELVKQGRRVDNTGRWINVETREEKQIFSLDEMIDEELWTKEKPLQNEPYQKWDKTIGKWVIDTEKKEQAEKETQLREIQAQIEEAERRIIRPLIAITEGSATPEDRGIFDQYASLIKNELRPERNKLEAELKSA